MGTEATVARILDAAERRFAMDGFAAVSLRAITRDADVNIAAIHYHFGSKEALIRAVLDRIVVPMVERRAVLLDAVLLQHGRPAPVEALLEAFLLPDLEALVTLRERNPAAAGLVGRTYAQPTPFVAELMTEQFAPTSARFLPEFEAALPHVAADEVAWRLRWGVVGVVLALFSGMATGSTRPPLDLDDLDGSLRRIVTFCAAAMAAAPAAVSHDL